MDSITNFIASGDYAEAIKYMAMVYFMHPPSTPEESRAAILLKAASSGVWLLETLEHPEQQNACRVMVESLIQEARRILINQ